MGEDKLKDILFSIKDMGLIEKYLVYSYARNNCTVGYEDDLIIIHDNDKFKLAINKDFTLPEGITKGFIVSQIPFNKMKAL